MRKITLWLLIKSRRRHHGVEALAKTSYHLRDEKKELQAFFSLVENARGLLQ